MLLKTIRESSRICEATILFLWTGMDYERNLCFVCQDFYKRSNLLVLDSGQLSRKMNTLWFAKLTVVFKIS